MLILIIGSLSGELGRAAGMARARGARIMQADTIGAALDLMRKEGTVDLVLCELDHDPIRLMVAMAAERIGVPVVACGVDPDPEEALAAVRAGAVEFLPLPPDPDLIAAILEAATHDTHALLARDPVMLSLLRRADQIAMSDASVLIVGESGTGKEILARHLHRRSRRASRPFVALNCAAVPEALLESELFGHEKGAFSGALARRVGKFESATGGTLLLDEVSEMDVRLQAKLLRAVQEREIDRLGGTAPVKIDVRILATSNRDLRAEIDAGRFRADLYFRLNVVTLAVPPLRERPGDIAPLAHHYVSHYAAANGLRKLPLSEPALFALKRYPWPGNVRELENAMHRAVLLASGDAIDIDAIELAGTVPIADDRMTDTDTDTDIDTGTATASASADRIAPDMSALVGRSVDDVERALIIGTLTHTHGNRTHAATILGISIRALRNKLKAYADEGVAVPRAPSGVVA